MTDLNMFRRSRELFEDAVHELRDGDDLEIAHARMLDAIEMGRESVPTDDPRWPQLEAIWANLNRKLRDLPDNGQEAAP